MNRNNAVSIYFVRGLPGTGKTTLSRKLKETLKASLLDPDDILITKEMLSSGRRLKNLKYKHLLNKVVADIKKGRNVIWCQPWRKSKNINLTVDNIRQLSGARPLNSVVIETLPDIEFSFHNSIDKFPNRKYFNYYIKKYTPLCGLRGTTYILLKESYTGTDISNIVKKFLNII